VRASDGLLIRTLPLNGRGNGKADAIRQCCRFAVRPDLGAQVSSDRRLDTPRWMRGHASPDEAIDV
jgi:hypothetical protein